MTAPAPTPAESPSAGRPGIYAKGIERRQQILDRALEVFHKRGLDGTSLRAIGEAIGVSHAALRHYFDSREQLLVEVLREADRQAIEVDQTLDRGAVDFLLRGAEYNMRIPGLMSLYNTMAAHALTTEGPAREFFVRRYSSLRRQLSTIFASAQGTGAMRADISAEDAAALTLAAFDGLAIQWLLDDEVGMRSAMHLLDRLFGSASSDD